VALVESEIEENIFSLKFNEAYVAPSQLFHNKTISVYHHHHHHKKMIKSLIVALVLCILAVYISCDETPTLLVHKSVKETEAIVNSNVTFTITIYNVGQR
jgi:hypothetical protein